LLRPPLWVDDASGQCCSLGNYFNNGQCSATASVACDNTAVWMVDGCKRLGPHLADMWKDTVTNLIYSGRRRSVLNTER